MPTAAEMPRYRSHKVVWALEIKSIVRNLAIEGGGWIVIPIDRGYAPIVLPDEVFARYMPVAGDFIVQYDDGYWSVSPRKAFTEGYTPIKGTGPIALDGLTVGVLPSDDISHANATGWLDQRSQPDHAVQELRRWALALANDGRGAKNAIEAAAEFEAYVLNGAPVAAKAETDTDDGR